MSGFDPVSWLTSDSNPLKDTWLWQLPAWLVATLGPVLGVLAIAAVLAGAILFGFLYIARGGGQYGIIEGYVGTIGAGKTTLAVQHALTLATARRAVLLANIPVICQPGSSKRAWAPFSGLPVAGRLRVGPHRYRPGCKDGVHVIEHDTLPMNDEGLDLGELTRRAFRLRDEGRGLVLLMDEVGVIMPARLWKEFSVALMWVLQQSRKLACEWIWTAQDVQFVDSQLRSLTAVVHYVRAYPPPSIWRRAKGKRPWALIASTFSPSSAPRANAEGLRRERRIARSVKLYRRAWEGAFDTDGVVLPSRHLKGAGVLVDAVKATGDRHVINPRLSDWGELEAARLIEDANGV